MTHVKLDLASEARKFIAQKPLKIEKDVLFHILALDYLRAGGMKA